MQRHEWGFGCPWRTCPRGVTLPYSATCERYDVAGGYEGCLRRDLERSVDQGVLPDNPFFSGWVDAGTDIRVAPRRIKERKGSGVRECDIGD